MRNTRIYKRIAPLAPAILVVLLSAGIVYAAQSYQVNNGTSVQINEFSVCGQIANNSGQAIFVPTNSSAEWSAFRGNLPSGVTNGSCCAANYGQGCSSAANACGQTNSGTYSCAGVCSASTPGNPAGYGAGCTSAANACGQTNSGTIQCNGSCSASTPANPAGYGQGCTSAPNSCGQTNSGTIQCNGSCSASTPANPAGYGQGCTSAPNSCGQTNSGTIQCDGSCSASTPSNAGCASCRYLPDYGGASCESVYQQSGGYYCPSYECQDNGGSCTRSPWFSCSNYTNAGSCNPWVTCDYF